jgi:aminoglycoside phosphotransferase (APT) family kinase protein
MRHNAYYWKCDCPLPAEERSVGFTAAKYDDEAVAEAARTACRANFGRDAEAVEPLRCAGNHHAYRVRTAGHDLLFRAAVDSTGDDYMRAEQALVALAAAQGVPVPQILACRAEPGEMLRWQLMELVPGATLADLDREGQLDRTAIASELGQVLARLHRVRIDGFGFIDTDRLRVDGTLRGLHDHYLGYVHCCLDRHLAYVADHGLFSPAEAAEAGQLIATLWPTCAPTQAVLVHRDPTWWNLIGSRSAIHALIDWDDAVGGDPADDLAMLRCFHDRSYTDAVEAAYWDAETPPADFERRIAVHWLRNMLWKAMLRHQLGYFRPGAAGFLAALAGPQGLEAATRTGLQAALTALRRAS